MENQESKSPKVSMKTYGCKVNTYDSGLLQDQLKKAGIENRLNQDVHIVNTCAVTREATMEALRHIRKMKKKNPDSLVVVTGCAAQVDADDFVNEEAADYIIANSHKFSMNELLSEKLEGKSDERLKHSNIFEKEELDAEGGLEEGRSRAFIKIQDGCNSFCTYCVIPFARGKSRSIPIPGVIDKVNELSSKGFAEGILTGIHIGDYASVKSVDDKLKVVSARGRNNPDRYYFLEDLIEQVLDYTKMPRFRLGSIEPGELTERLLRTYDNPRMCPHFHMSIQSACSKTLKDMKRKYDAKLVEKSLTDIQRLVPDAFVGMDVIVGFPGETASDFEETYERLASLPWTRIHVFPYSDRPGTKSESYAEKVDGAEKKRRASLLRELSSKRFKEKALEQIGQIKDCILLSKYKNKSKLQVLSRDYWQMELINVPETFDMDQISQGEFKVKVLSFDDSNASRMDGKLVAELMEY